MTAQRTDGFYQALRARSRAGSRPRRAPRAAGRISPRAPDLFHLLCRLALDKDVPAAHKVKLAGAVAYFISPFDLVPEALTGPIGYVDDVAVAAFVLNALVNESGKDLVARHWAGQADLLGVIRRILAFADEMLGSGLWARLKARL